MSSLVLYAEGECQAWFLENSVDSTVAQILPIIDSQAICLQNVYLVDGCLTSTLQFNGCGWIWNDTPEKIQLMGTRIQ